MAEVKDLDLAGKLTAEQRAIEGFRMDAISPDDGKYGKSVDPLRDYLSPRAEWIECAAVQLALIEARAKFSQATDEQVREVSEAIKKINPLNVSLLEEKVTKHDQLALIEEIGRFVSPGTKALLHPGTTSYDILDTARSILLKGAWYDVVRPAVSDTIFQLCDIAGRSMDILQAGRTHLQNTSPVPFISTFAGYSARIAERTERCDLFFNDLRGKISGIVGTGASIERVIGEGKSIDFERAVLDSLGLKADTTATQIVQKERFADVGHGLTTLMHVLGNFANDIRLLYSSAIQEVTSRDNAERLGGSSADATKNNPIQYENVAGKVAVVESGMRVMYEMIRTNLQRDLRGSVQARYQPAGMIAEVYESFVRMNKALPQLSINTDVVSVNLQSVRDNPSEAMVAILRGQGWNHSKYGVGHDFVKSIGLKAKKSGRKLLDVALEDPEFNELYLRLPETDGLILKGEIQRYVGHAISRAIDNIAYARGVARTVL
jgi:adenylosuccinate lyase